MPYQCGCEENLKHRYIRNALAKSGQMNRQISSQLIYYTPPTTCYPASTFRLSRKARFSYLIAVTARLRLLKVRGVRTGV
jgi:hypothetical protein